MPIKQHPLFTVSTAHLSPSDARLLESGKSNLDAAGEVNVILLASTPFGFLIFIGDEGLDAEAPATLSNAGFSQSFASLLTRIYEEAGGSCYLMLDPDGPCIDSFPISQR
jgi:hypothetical protein